MDATHPVWRTSTAAQAAAAGDFGALIRMARIAKQLTLVQAAELLRYSASTLSRIETGHRRMADIVELRMFVDLLGIPPHLFGLTPSPAVGSDGAALSPSASVPTTVSTEREGGDDAVRRRQLLTGLLGVTGSALVGLSQRPSGGLATPAQEQLSTLLSAERQVVAPLGVPALRQRLAAARTAYQTCRYHDLATTLPDVIAAAQHNLAAATGQRYEQTAALVADAYSLASNLCSRLREDTLGWVMAEHARTTAQLSGQPASIAEAARVSSIAMRRFDHHDMATTLLTTTALTLGADSGDPAPDLLAAYGSLLCTAAYTAAQNGHRHQALDLISEAESAAGRISEARAAHTSFSPTNVVIYQIGVQTALGDAGAALDYASTIDLRSVPTPERRARFCIDTARAWHRFGNTHNSFRALQVADRCAPEEVRRSSVRTLVTTLLGSPGTPPSGLREFAVHCGAVA